MSALSSSKLYSHPDKFLEDHLIKVANIAEENINSSPVGVLNHFEKNTLSRIVRICGLCHDIGKSTRYFQSYLFASEEEKNKLKIMDETHHSLLSAVVSFYAVMSEFETKKDLKGDEKAFLAFIAFLAVRRHHGNLEDVLDEAAISEKRRATLMIQVQNIDDDKLHVLNQHLKMEGLKQAIEKNLMKEWVLYIHKDLRAIKRRLRKLEREKSLNLYLMTNLIFSVLIDADKSEVTVGRNIERSAVKLNYTMVDNYKNSMDIKQSKLNELREQAYNEVLNQPINLRNRILSINLPTGLGKTFTSIAFALKLREKIKDEKGFVPRIIYSLPFLSIIEQNADEFENILKSNGINVDTNMLLKHHHLSDVYYTRDESEFEPADAKILIEGWNSEIIVTTFVQFFHTLLSNRNKSLRKFHRLSGSIILLDEVQSIPFKYWLLVRELLTKLAEEFDSYVVFITATEPLIFPRDEVFDLVNREYYFGSVDRVVIRPRVERDITIGEFASSLDLTDDKSQLFILNTIESAKALYKSLKAMAQNEKVTFLSTHVVPHERLKRIEQMRKGDVKFAVTTQLVEAGVDIDFDVVYRDLAPLDSINQAAGRCNRNGERRGEVIIMSLKDERKPYSSYIYDDVLLDITRYMIQDKEHIHERDFLSIIDKYYKIMQDKMSNDESSKLLTAVYKMKYDSIDETPCIADFKLITDYPKLDVFIELDDDAQKIWREYSEIKEIRNIFERRLAFSKIKADFYRYTVAVPINIENLPPEVNGFRYVNNYSLEDFYDSETGFKCKGVVSLW